MKRTKGWERRLSELFKARAQSPFKWGTNDCCMFVADAVRVVTEVDIGEWFRGRYKTRTKAFRLLKEFAQGSVTETMDRITAKYGMKETKEVPPGPWQHKALLAGDIVTMKAHPLDPIAGHLSNGVTVGIQSFTKGAVLSPGKDGLVLSTQPHIHKAWTL